MLLNVALCDIAISLELEQTEHVRVDNHHIINTIIFQKIFYSVIEER